MEVMESIILEITKQLHEKGSDNAENIFKDIGSDLLSKGIIKSYDITHNNFLGVYFIGEHNFKLLGLEFDGTKLRINNLTLPMFSIEKSLSIKISNIQLQDIFLLTSYFNFTYEAMCQAFFYRNIDWSLLPKDNERLNAFCEPWLHNLKYGTWDCKKGEWL